MANSITRNLPNMPQQQSQPQPQMQGQMPQMPFGGNIPMPNGINNINNLMGQIQNFKKSLNGQNPQAIVQNMLQSGQINQQQFQQIAQTAQQICGMMK